ncbi:unnamed protein product, partial [Amoebophrya sp. A25]|eukprot:GSA25T00002550001.1
MNICIESAPGYQYDFHYKKQQHSQAVTLHYTLSDVHECHDHMQAHEYSQLNEIPDDGYDSRYDTRVWLKGANFERRRYLFLNNYEHLVFRPPLHGKHAGHNRFEILRGPAFRNKLYVKGMLVQQPHLDSHGNTWRGARRAGDKWYGYNFLDFDMKSRDRENSISYHEERANIVQAWHEVLCLCRGADSDYGNAWATEAARHLMRTFESKPECFECQCISQSSDANGNLVKKKVWTVFQKRYAGTNPHNGNIVLPQPFASGNESKKKLIIKCGYRPIAVPTNLYNMLAGFLPDLDEEYLTTRANELEKLPADRSGCGRMFHDILAKLFREIFSAKIQEARQNWSEIVDNSQAARRAAHGYGGLAASIRGACSGSTSYSDLSNM